MDLAVVALTFGAIFVVELPDKTFIATLVLATKFRPVLVWLGVGLAFTVQTAVAVALGHAASFLPTDAVRAVALVMFLVGAVILFRQGRSHQVDRGDEYAEKAGDASGLKAVGASFVVLFAAEWGDLSQLLTLTLVARYEDPVERLRRRARRAAGGQRPRGPDRPRAAPRRTAAHAPLRRRRGLPGARRLHRLRAARRLSWVTSASHRWTPHRTVREDCYREGTTTRGPYMTIFDQLDDREVDTIKNTGTHVTLPADWSPIWEKTPADKAYIIVSRRGVGTPQGRGDRPARTRRHLRRGRDRQPQAAQRLDRHPHQGRADPLQHASRSTSSARRSRPSPTRSTASPQDRLGS